MDPLGVLADVVDANAIPKWSETPPFSCPCHSNDGARRPARPSPFPVRTELNQKVVLWAGDVTKLNTVVIVNSTNESLSSRGPLSERIHLAAGPELLAECKQQLLGCRTGEAKLSKGYNLPARYVVHTVGPRYNTKYRTAAESALFSCYRSVMRILRENQLTSVGLSVINTIKRGYPPEDGAHIALRTVRRFLEHYGSCMELVVFVVEAADVSIYSRLMPLYFPRNEVEEHHAADELPVDIGNEEGEPIIAERQIRIKDHLIGERESGDDDDDDSDTPDGMLLPSVGKHAFAAMAGDQDQINQQRLQRTPSKELHAMEQQRLYQRWLRRARTEDFTELERQKMIYQSGIDFLGRPVVVFVSHHFPASSVDLNKVVAYFVKVLDRIVNRDYVVVYFHTLSSEDNQPPLSFLKDLFHTVDNKYRRNLKSFYVVHPTFWARLVTWFFTTFTASSIKNKVHFLSGVQFLYDWINPDQLDIPSFVLEYDMRDFFNSALINSRILPILFWPQFLRDKRRKLPHARKHVQNGELMRLVYGRQK